MKHLTDTRLWDQIIRDAVEHCTMQEIYYEAGYRAGFRAQNESAEQRKDTNEKI